MVKSEYKPFYYIQLLLLAVGYIALYILIARHFPGIFKFNDNPYKTLIVLVLPFVVLYLYFSNTYKKIILTDKELIIHEIFNGKSLRFTYDDISSTEINVNTKIDEIITDCSLEETSITFKNGYSLTISAEIFSNYSRLKHEVLKHVKKPHIEVV